MGCDMKNQNVVNRAKGDIRALCAACGAQSFDQLVREVMTQTPNATKRDGLAAIMDMLTKGELLIGELSDGEKVYSTDAGEVSA